MGFFRDIKTKAKKRIGEELDERKELSKVRRTALREARIKEAGVFAKKKARMETTERLKPKKAFDFKGFAGPTQQSPTGGSNLADALLGTGKKGKKKYKEMRIL